MTKSLGVTVLVLAVAVGCLAGCERSREPAPRPNIVLIYVDDLDFDEIGVYDHVRQPTYSGAAAVGGRVGGKIRPASQVLTPHIDGLARDGALFTRFYVTSPACTPSRYSALTGRYASRSAPLAREHPPGGPALVGWKTYLGRDESNIARELRRLGYRTGHVGKWHLSGEDPMAIRMKRLSEDFDPRAPAAVERMRSAYEERLRFVREAFGFDFVASLYIGNLGNEGWDRSLNHHNMEWVTAGALEFLEQGSSEQPFFLFLAPTLLHGLYQSAKLEGDAGATPLGFVELPPVQPARESIRERIERSGLDPATGLSTWLDDAVGAVLAKLDEKGVADDTLVMLVSDHQSRGKFTLYESARVPALVRWPRRIEPGRRIADLAANVDLVPTFVELAGGDPDGLDVDGRSLVPLLEGDGDGERDSVYLEIAYARGVVTEDWKYIAVRYPEHVRERIESRGSQQEVGWDGKFREGPKGQNITRFGVNRHFRNYSDPDQLYDLDADPYEQTNLAADPRFAGRLAELQNLLRRELSALPHTFGEFDAP